MKWTKYHALGNDYLIADPRLQQVQLTPEQVAKICHRHYGLGADGILVGPKSINENHFQLDIYNADGSLAEISGNGTTIFATYLRDTQTVLDEQKFYLHPSPHCEVQCCCYQKNSEIQVEVILGPGRYQSPLFWPVPPQFQQQFDLPPTLQLYPVNIRNPHCVVLVSNPTKALACTLGPMLEHHPYFPQKTNIQFVTWNSHTPQISIEIWERGSGYTLGSGSSACAVACVYRHLFPNNIRDMEIHTPGGQLIIHEDNSIFSFVNRAYHVFRGDFEIEM